jgi:hypothetical protein
MGSFLMYDTFVSHKASTALEPPFAEFMRAFVSMWVVDDTSNLAKNRRC